MNIIKNRFNICSISISHHLNSEDLKFQLETGKLNKEELTEEQQSLLEKQFVKDNYQYCLKGIVVHSGSIESGHFYSYIYDRESTNPNEKDKWILFNDSEVGKINPSEIPEETFGGNEKFLNIEFLKKSLVMEQIPNKL